MNSRNQEKLESSSQEISMSSEIENIQNNLTSSTKVLKHMDFETDLEQQQYAAKVSFTCHKMSTSLFWKLKLKKK
jgi:hypothetical protein